MLEVPDLRVDIISIFIHGLKKGAVASALAREPPADVEDLMTMAERYILAGGPACYDSFSSRRRYVRATRSSTSSSLGASALSIVESSGGITFDDRDLERPKFSHDDLVVVTMDIANFVVQKVLVDNGSSTNIIYLNVLNRMDQGVANITPVNTLLMGFGGSEVIPLGTIDLPTSLGSEPYRRTMMIKYFVVDAPFAYNVTLG